MKEVTKKVLRRYIKKAQNQGKNGLAIWPNWTVWEDFSYQMRRGNEIYDFVLERINQGEISTIACECLGLELADILIVPVDKIATSDKVLEEVLSICKKSKHQGPITFLPENF